MKLATWSGLGITASVIEDTDRLPGARLRGPVFAPGLRVPGADTAGGR